MQHFIPAYNVATLLRQIEQLNKRAKRLGIEPITMTDAGPVEDRQLWEIKCKGGTNWLTGDMIRSLTNAPELTGQVMPVHAVEVVGKAPSLNGWHFVATLEPLTTDNGMENLVRCAPGEECPSEFRTRIGECDHCGAHRRRKETFVLRHDSGETCCVGRQCIKDFLNFHADPSSLATAAELLFALRSLCDKLSDWDGSANKAERTWTLETVLSWTASIIRHDGWLSRTKAREQGRWDATADKVFGFILPPATDLDRAAWAKRCEEYKPTAENIANAQAAIDWALTLTDPDGDYLANVNLIARCGYVKGNTMGVAASILVAWQRATQPQDKAPVLPSNWQGVVGQRGAFANLRVTHVIVTESQWGSTGIHKLIDDQGNQFTWFASSSAKWLSVGDVVSVKAGIKAHDEYKGTKQTILTRVTVTD